MAEHDQQSLRDDIGQMMMVGFKGLEPTPEIIELIEQYRIGNIVLFSRNIKDAGQLSQVTSKLQLIAREAGHKQPLLIATDQENGMVRRFDDVTPFPGNMAQGAMNDADMTYRIAFATGQELLATGVNMNLAPVVDVNNNPLNPVIGVRSFGEDPALVGRLGASCVRGLQDAGVIANLKHFPGHGDTATDSHLALPIVEHNIERLRAIELPPFADGIHAGAASIMIAHLALPAIIGDTTPACLSAKIVTDLLRNAMQYTGVIMTDCLEMDAIKETVGVTQGAIMAANAGNDLILISHTYQLQTAAIQGLLFVCQDGQIPRGQIAVAAERIRTLKSRYLQWDAPKTTFDMGQHKTIANEAYRRSVTVARNQQSMIPLNLEATGNMLVIIPRRSTLTMVEDKGYPVSYLAEQILQRDPSATVHYLHENESVESPQLQQKIVQADTILVCTMNALRDPAQVAVMQHSLSTGKPVVGIGLFQPYDLNAFPSLKSYIAAFECTRPAIDAVLAVLFGDCIATGKLPVSIA